MAGSLRRVSDPTDAADLREAFIDTYAGGDTVTAAELVAQYERVREHVADHPNQGSSAVASRLDLPRSRIRTWVDDGGRPDAARGLDTLTSKGWLHLDWDGSALRALACLVVWTVAGGSIARQYWQPAWSVSPGTERDLERIGDVLGLEWRQRHVDDERSGTEWVPTPTAPLGRLLAVLGAPTAAREGPALPPWLVLDAPRAIRLDASRVIVRQRGTAIGKPTSPIQLALRESGRREAIVRLLRSVIPPDGDIRTGESQFIRLDRRAAELLGAPPTLGDPLPDA